MDPKHTEWSDPSIGIGKFDQIDQVVQDIRDMKEKYDSRFPLYRRARSAEPDMPPEESLPLFLSTPDDQELPPPRQEARPQNPRPQDTRYQAARNQGARPQDIRYQDKRYQTTPYQDTAGQNDPYQDSPYQDTQDTWLHDAMESDRERVKSVVGSTVLKRALKAGFLTATVVAALVAVFTLEDHRSLISNASASLAAVLPGFSGARPVQAKEQTATTTSAPVVTAAAAPTREAISVAYQTALQTQPELRQAPVAPVAAPPPAPAPAAVRRLDPDELAMLLKRAQGLMDVGDFPGARLLLERAADAHEAKAAYILAQTYDPAVLGTADSRSITPNPEAARLWYQKAAQFGSQEAQQRLAQMQ